MSKCYKCKYRGTVPGDTHSCCKHPDAQEGGGVIPALHFILGYNKINIKFDETGIKGGWVMWPLNFDPAWLISCDGFKSNIKDK